jgi:phosphoribosylamine--glycine ligase
LRVLLVGNRAIQHALAVRLQHEGCVVDVYPGQRFGGYNSVDASDALDSDYDLIVMGSARYFDDPAIAQLRRRGIPFFGTDAEAGELETSKSVFKDFAAACGIPTPPHQCFTDPQTAMEHLRSSRAPYVVKADGPARGCGVAICQALAEAGQDLERKLTDRSSPYYSGAVVIEEYVPGFEIAVNVFMDDDSYVVLPETKPHKRRNSSDLGPNVAGMGSRAPIVLNEDFYADLRDRVMTPTLSGLRSRGWSFRGCLFVNLMLNEDGLVVLEFNCRVGDPAGLVDLLLLESSVTELLMATVENRLNEVSLTFKDGVGIAVTLVDHGYPDGPVQVPSVSMDPSWWLNPGDESGLIIAGAESGQDAGAYTVTGGVVAAAVAVRPDFAAAQAEAHRIADLLPGLHRRSDIGDVVNPPARYVGDQPDAWGLDTPQAPSNGATSHRVERPTAT